MTRPSYPLARRCSGAQDISGQRVSDPYQWLEDAHSDETQEWSTTQDALFRSARGTWTYRSSFRERLSRLSSRGWVSAPLWRGQRQFLMRLAAGADHPVLVVVDPDASEKALLDPALLDPSGKTTLAGDRPGKVICWPTSSWSGAARNPCCGSWTWPRARSWTARSRGPGHPPSGGFPGVRGSTTSVSPIRVVALITGSGSGGIASAWTPPPTSACSARAVRMAVTSRSA